MLVNTNGLAFIGPGSEWFWSMLQFLVVAVTLVGIYYQLRSSQSANAFTQLGELVDEWQGERLTRKRRTVYLALRDGAAPADIPDSPAEAIANYREKVGSLVRAGHMAPRLIAEGHAGAEGWWGILEPWVQRVRTEDANPKFYEHFVRFTFKPLVGMRFVSGVSTYTIRTNQPRESLPQAISPSMRGL
jgi:hypothetical protein